MPWLDVTPPILSPKQGRGRPSKLHKAKEQAGDEVIQGKQHTIERVLRAKDTLPNPPP